MIISIESGILIFASSCALNKLCQADTWFMDGNFSLAPANFAQLYIIRIPLGNNGGAISAVYALLQGKDASTYNEFLRALLNVCFERNFFPDPKTVVCDFELAVMASVHNVLGNHVLIQGCFYHLTQSTWRKIRELGLVKLYKRNADFRQLCTKIDALVFLPSTEHVKNGMFYLKTTAPPEGIDLIDYFDTTYVSGSYRSLGGGDNGMRLRRIPPRFPPTTWNVNHATINNNVRTNNICKGWNNKFSHLVNKKHPSIWRLINSLQLEEATVSAEILKFDELGVQPKPKTPQVYVKMQERLKGLCIEFNERERSMENFLTAIANNIHHKQYAIDYNNDDEYDNEFL